MAYTDHFEPIVAIATAPGKGGVGIIRISVPKLGQAHQLLRQMMGKIPEPRKATRLALCSPDGILFDDGLLLYFPAPHSYTAEHVIEFQGHGGTAVLQMCLLHILEQGQAIQLRLARAGEFTERAFLNDKLDLAQAEAVADLIDAGSITAAKAAAASLSGIFSKQINELADAVIHLRLLVEASLDFPEEDIEFLEKSGALHQLNACRARIHMLLTQARQGAKLKEGLNIVLAGRPNVGKSSLLNSLAGQDIAIVAPRPGTTRDRISQAVEIAGIPVIITDTAGLRHTHDDIEQLGIARTWQSLQQADMVLHIMDVTQMDGLATEPIFQLIQPDVTEHIPAHIPVIEVFNKIDVLNIKNNRIWPSNGVAVSAKTGQGLDRLRDAILTLAGLQPDQDFAFLARQRHIEALLRSQNHLLVALEHIQNKTPVLELFAEELRLAHDALGEITGRMLPDDLLGLIFSRFCIGK